MKNFKKACKTTVLFLLILVILSASIMELFFQSESYFYQDYRERDELAGTLDTLILGSSHGLRAFVPEIMDKKLGVNSYNLAGSLMTMQGKYEMLRTEADRNPVKTVILEMAASSLTRNRVEEGPEGDVYLLGRFSHFIPRLSYFLRAFRPSEYGRAYYVYLARGVQCAYKLKNGTLWKYNKKSVKGHPEFHKDYKSVRIKYKKKYNTESLNTEIYDWNVKYLDKITAYCKEKGIRLILATTPISLAAICRFDNYDVARERLVEYCEKNELEYYDFNILKKRNELFSDKTSFHDRYHLGNTGARDFTRYFCSFMKKIDKGQDVSKLFYKSYAEFESDQDYAK